LFSFDEEQYELEVPALLQVYVVYFLYTSPAEQKAEPVYPDVPQSAFFEHSIFWSVHVPDEHV